MRTTTVEPSKSFKRKRQVKISPLFFVDQLARDLYKDPGACLLEVYKNCVGAYMPHKKWLPELIKNVRIEITLVKNHPLAPGCTSLVIKDAGPGFTEFNLKRFFELGPGEDETTTNEGLNEKRMGKLAMNALNSKSMMDFDTGFILMSRTSSRGPVIFIECTPHKYSENTFEECEIGEDATELGPHRNLTGSFSIFVIPNSVLKDEREIREALEWKIPRFRDKSVHLTIGGKLIEPPPLASKMKQSGDGPTAITAYLERLEAVILKDEDCSGVWLTDPSGIRCAYAPELGAKHLPYPLYESQLKGDIVCPGLLAQQRTDRQGLKPRFLKTKAWREIVDRLRLHISPFAQQLLGDQNLMRDDDPTTKLFHDLAQEFADVFGAGEIPNDDIIPGTQIDGTGVKNGGVKNGTTRPGTHHGGSGPGAGPTKGGGTGKRRTQSFKIGGKSYYFTFLPQPDAEIFAEISVRSNAICINPNYGIKLKTPSSQREHCLLRIFETVAHHHEPDADTARRLISRYMMQRAAAKE